jgi:hypothetical protein
MQAKVKLRTYSSRIMVSNTRQDMIAHTIPKNTKRESLDKNKIPSVPRITLIGINRL